jgi:hypothetical protein
MRVALPTRTALVSRTGERGPSAWVRPVSPGGSQPLTTGWSRRGDPRGSAAALGAFHLSSPNTNALDRCIPWRYSGTYKREGNALWP